MLSCIVPNRACTFTEGTILALRRQFHCGWTGYCGSNTWVCRLYAQDKEIPKTLNFKLITARTTKLIKQMTVTVNKNEGQTENMRNSLIGFSGTNKIIPSDLKRVIGMKLRVTLCNNM